MHIDTENQYFANRHPVQAWNDVQFIFLPASPNAYSEINSPLPRLTEYHDKPLVGEWIYDKHERPETAFPQSCENGDFSKKGKAQNALIIVLSDAVSTPLSATPNFAKLIIISKLTQNDVKKSS